VSSFKPAVEAPSLRSREDIDEQLGTRPHKTYFGASPLESADPCFSSKNADSMYIGFNGLFTSLPYNEHKYWLLNELWMVAWSAGGQMTTIPTTTSGLSGYPYYYLRKE